MSWVVDILARSSLDPSASIDPRHETCSARGPMLIAASAAFILLAWLCGTRRFVEVLLLTRSICDPLFALTKSVSRDDIGLGASLNFAVIMVAIGCVISRPGVKIGAAGSLWLPFFVVAILAVIIAPDQIAASRLYLTLVSHAACCLLAFYVINNLADLRHFILIILAGSIVPTLVGVMQIAFGWAETEDGTRVQSTFAHPNIYAFYLITMLSLVFILLAERRFDMSRWLKKALLLYVPILLMLILMTKTRSAWIATGLILTVYAVRFDRRFLLYFCAAPLLLVIMPELAERISDLQEGNYTDANAKLNSYTWRILIWQSAFDWIWQRPIFGWGLDGFSYYVSQFSIIKIESGNVDSHSVFVQILFEMGLIGLTAYIWIYARLFYMIFKLIKHRDVWAWMVVALIFGYLFICYSDNMLYYLVPSWYMWFVLGGSCAVIQSHRSEQKLSYQMEALRRRLRDDQNDSWRPSRSV